MKCALLFLCLLGGCAAAAPYYLPTPQPGALTSADWQPTIRLEGLYAIGASHTPDTAGFRLGQNLYSSADSRIRHEFDMQVAPQWGSGHRTRYAHRSHQDIFMAPLTGGYTLNLGLTDDVYLFLGGKRAGPSAITGRNPTCIKNRGRSTVSALRLVEASRCAAASVFMPRWGMNMAAVSLIHATMIPGASISSPPVWDGNSEKGRLQNTQSPCCLPAAWGF